MRDLQLEAESEIILVAGASGTGKSTFALRLLVADRDLSCRFLFDPEGEFSKRYDLPAVINHEEWLGALDDGFVIYDPHHMFPGRMQEAFSWFCFHVFQCASFLPGRKIALVDEAWKYCTPATIPETLANCIQTGRKRGLAMLFATQRPNRLNESITNEVTELVAFRLQGKNALQRVEDLGADPSEVAALAPGQFVAVNCKRGGELRGSLW